MKQCIDTYHGWIVANVDGVWRHVYIQPGWVTFAPWDAPNQHIGVCREMAIDEAGAKNVEDLATSRFALVGPQALENDVLDRVAFVRFGRAKTFHKPVLIADGALLRAIAEDLDNENGLRPEWPRFNLPARPKRWTRTPRSLIIS